MKRTMMLSALTAVGLFCAAGSAQVVISQVYGGGGNGGGLYRADFIELKNIGNAPVDITGWTVQRTSAGASGNFSAGQSSAPFPAFVLQPGQYYLVEGATGAGTTQPALPSPNLVAGNLTLGASDGKVALVNSSTIISITNPAHFDQTTMNPIIGGASPIVDFVGYGANASHYEGFDGTPNLGNSLAAIRLNNGCTDTNDNSLDFIVGTPEPHAGGSIVACGAAFPDVAIQLSNSACNPTAGSSFEVTASVSNLLGTGAQGTVATIVLPPTLSFTSVNTGGVGTTAYDAATRTLTWNLGTVAGGGSASATVAATAVAEGGVVVRGSVTTTTANDPVGNNAAVSYSEALSTAAPLGVIAVASSSDTSVATSVDENGTERKLGTIYRPFASANGEWIVFRTDLASLPGTSNTGVVVGHNTGSGWVFALVAREGATAPVAGQPTWVIDASTFGNVLGINDAGEYVYTARLRDTLGTAADNTDDVLHWVLVKGTVSGGVSLVIKGGDTNHAGNADADPAVAAELAGRDYITVGSSTIQNDGTVSFFATLSGSTTSNAAFLTDGGATVLAQKGVTVPGGSTTPWASLDSDVSSDGRGLFVSANGASWLGTGAVDTGGDTSTDNAVAVNGTIAVREGSPVGGFTEPASWATFGSQQVPWTQMLPDGSWYIHGFNATGGFNQGQDWVNRGGVIIAATGQSIFGLSTERWNDAVLQRTFFLVAGSGDNYVVGGLTDRSLAANGGDVTTDGLVVFRSGQVLVREGNPVQLSPSDTRYLNLINDNRSFVAGGALYMTATLRNADSECAQTFTGLPQAIVAVPLPTANPCPADLGVQGGGVGSDGVLDNNDFIAFITLFFNQDARADLGRQGGVGGSDGAWDNNDFIAFITYFFQGCGN